ncbi:phosphoenolpyruvate synthase [Alphaproteobacteria bacterium KMM 3653]|uniref:Phosphoenolpyruvate synthase n=1 Tax=Harenicola maris TaxID=2841044 RepID=A0AAP2CK50_9RHOB|nr:phosphoenolpyruvate synthase [Harenicola maris]
MSQNILPADKATDPATAGGKAASLARLQQEGFDVPAFFVLLPQAVAEAQDDKQARRRLNREVKQAAAEIGPGPYAVRSSGRAEDGVEHSHAGQFLTELNVTAPRVLTAAETVYASGFTGPVETYRALKSSGGAEAPAIVIQQMIPARAAGVAFSADPVSGARESAVISATTGLGDKLVDGTVDGEDWTITADGTAAITPDAPEAITEAEALQIATLARRAEETFGSPQDIEWAITGTGEDARLILLQSRPITTQLRAPARPDPALTVFDNSNIVESYPGLVSPLTYSFASYSYNRVYRAFVALLGVQEAQIAANGAVFENLLARVDGRVYYNLGNWYRALAMLPGFAMNRAHMETMMGVDTPLPEELTASIGPPPPTNRRAKWAEYARMLRVGFGLLRQALRLRRTKAGFMTRLQDALTQGPDLSTANLTELAATYRRIEGELLDQWDAPLVNDFLCMMGFGASRKLLVKWAGEAGAEFHNDLMIGQGDIVSAEPAQRIAALAALVREADLADALQSGGLPAMEGHPEIAAAFDAYLEKFGDRCTEELKLESIPLTEDPSQLTAAILAGARRPPSEKDAHPAPNWRALLRNPLKRAVAKPICHWARNRVRDRENLRFERTRIFGQARRVFLAMGRELAALGHINTPRDVLNLTVGELLAAAEGGGLTHSLRALIALRAEEMAHAATRPDPDERLELRGAPLIRPSAQTTKPEDAGQSTDILRIATGCSAGQCTAKARVIRDPRSESLTPGDILVARNTDPGWIAVFANASAIVVERGSLLSHSAIVARELGIPCVVGLKGATDWIPDGAQIAVDGAAGTVEILP